MNAEKQRLRVAFMGTPYFAVQSLASLIISRRHEIVCVYTKAPKPAGRGHALTLSPVHDVAATMGLPVRHPTTLRDPAVQEEFAALDLDVAIVAAYGLILPKAILDAPRQGCVNIHASLLPRWRGAAPIQRAILAGDQETGITIMQMEEGLDTGPMLLKRAIAIGPETDAGDLLSQLARLSTGMIGETLANLAELRASATPQPEEGVTYAAKLTREEGRIDWRRPAVELDRLVRAFHPAPGAWFELNGERIKLLATRLVPDIVVGSAVPGCVLDDKLTISTGDGALRALGLQRPGKAMTRADDFLRGFPIPPGTILS